MVFSTQVKVTGVQELADRFGNLKVAIVNKAWRKGLTKAAQVVAKATKANISTKTATGFLRKSIGQKVKVPRVNPRTGAAAKPAYAIVGPRSKFREFRGLYTRGKQKGFAREHIPAKIAHLVEYGHGGPHPAPAYPFMRPAWQSTKARAFAELRRAAEEVIMTAART